MRENILVISKDSKKDVRDRITNFFEKYEEHFYPIIRVKTRDKKTIIGIPDGMRYALHLEDFSGGRKSIEYENISSVKILHNRDLFSIIRSLTQKTEALSEKRLKEIENILMQFIKTAQTK